MTPNVFVYEPLHVCHLTKVMVFTLYIPLFNHKTFVLLQGLYIKNIFKYIL